MASSLDELAMPSNMLEQYQEIKRTQAMAGATVKTHVAGQRLSE
jgi:hypothetical protein